jgi:hypothetical protein
MPPPAKPAGQPFMTVREIVIVAGVMTFAWIPPGRDRLPGRILTSG